MKWIVARMKGILIISGLLTFTMIQAAIAPDAALSAAFGTTLEDPLALLIVRNWGILIALVGVMLIHAAYHPKGRRMAITIAGLSKLAFILLVLIHGSQFLSAQAGIAVAVDAIIIAMFAGYLLQSDSRRAAISTPA